MDRRDFLRVAAGASAALIAVEPARATPAAMQEAIREVVGSAPVKSGRVKLDLPPLSENGNTVPMTVTVESAMSPADHVKAIHVFNEKNPQPNVVDFFLGPRAGRAVVSTRIRLADTQTVVAIAELSDGSFWSARVSVVVTLAACLEDA
jgi:sulfur-oxidizing protein SoxY